MIIVTMIYTQISRDDEDREEGEGEEEEEEREVYGISSLIHLNQDNVMVMFPVP